MIWIGRPFRRGAVKALRGALLALAAILALLATARGVAWWQDGQLPPRFSAVEPGRLYRSARVSPRQLQRLQREYGIARVISLLNPNSPDSRAEQSAAQRLGLQWYNVPLPGGGASTPADRQCIRALLTEPGAPPTLVHCAGGMNRTGLAVGIYRLHAQRWTLAQVMAELRATGFNDSDNLELHNALAAEAERVAAEQAPPTSESP